MIHRTITMNTEYRKTKNVTENGKRKLSGHENSHAIVNNWINIYNRIWLIDWLIDWGLQSRFFRKKCKLTFKQRYWGQSSGANFNQWIWIEGVPTRHMIRAQHKDIYSGRQKQLYDKVLYLGSDPKEHSILSLHITQNQ